MSGSGGMARRFWHRGGRLLSRLGLAGLPPLSHALDRGQAALADASRVTRFLHERSRFAGRPDDIFISSYPRSGTTWLQYMLVLLAHDGDPGFGHIGEAAPWFERNLALGRRCADDFASMPGPRVFKSHLPFAWLPRGGRYVYAVRDGRDVAVSYYHLYRSHIGFSGDFDAFFTRFMAGDVQYRSWFKHVAGWREVAGRSDVCLLEYERMRADPVATMARLNRFGGFGRSESRLPELAELCSLEAMKRQQERFDHATEERALRGLHRGEFIRSGASGGYRECFSPAQLRSFETAAAVTRSHPGRELWLAAFLH